MNIRLAVAGLVLMAASAFAADIDGKWSGNVDTPNGALTIAYSFKADGAKLTGTMTGPDGAEVKIVDGKIEGNKLSFNVTLEFGVLAFTGVVSPTDLQLAADFGGMPFAIALKKA